MLSSICWVVPEFKNPLIVLTESSETAEAIEIIPDTGTKINVKINIALAAPTQAPHKRFLDFLVGLFTLLTDTVAELTFWLMSFVTRTLLSSWTGAGTAWTFSFLPLMIRTNNLMIKTNTLITNWITQIINLSTGINTRNAIVPPIKSTALKTLDTTPRTKAVARLPSANRIDPFGINSFAYAIIHVDNEVAPLLICKEESSVSIIVLGSSAFKSTSILPKTIQTIPSKTNKNAVQPSSLFSPLTNPIKAANTTIRITANPKRSIIWFGPIFFHLFPDESLPSYSTKKLEKLQVINTFFGNYLIICQTF